MQNHQNSSTEALDGVGALADAPEQKPPVRKGPPGFGRPAPKPAPSATSSPAGATLRPTSGLPAKKPPVPGGTPGAAKTPVETPAIDGAPPTPPEVTPVPVEGPKPAVTILPETVGEAAAVDVQRQADGLTLTIRLAGPLSHTSRVNVSIDPSPAATT